jgi:arylsulfatase B
MHPQQRGFDEFFGFMNEGHYYVPPPWPGVTTWLRRKALPDGGEGRWTSPDGRIIDCTDLGQTEPAYDANNPLLRSSQPVEERANLTDAFTREACDFIQRRHTQPFFLYLAYNAVHSPMQATDAWMKKFAHIPDMHRRIFAAMLGHMDDSMGKVMAALDKYHLRENTFILFLSDNGGPTDELTSSNAPLRGFKGDLWEGGLRVPFIISWPAKMPKGRVIDTPVISMDATATAMEIAGAVPKKAKLDGVSLLPLLQDNAPRELHEDLFWRVGKKNALRHGDWKIIRNGGPWQLYDLKSDQSETRDLAPQHLDKVQELESTWERWSAEQAPPAWGGPAKKTKK